MGEFTLPAILILELAVSIVLVAFMTGNLPTGAPYGRHRKSTAQIHGSTDHGTDPSPGGTSPCGSTLANPWQPQPGALANITTNPFAHAQQQLMAHHALSPPAMLGSAGHQAPLGTTGLHWVSAQAQAAQMQAAWMQAQLQHQQQTAQQNHQLGVRLLQVAAATPPHPQTALKSEGVRAGEIIAWRAWLVVGETLRSATASVVWSPDEPMQGDAAAGFGIHAYKSPHGPMLDGYADIHQQREWVIGEVALWGDVIEHERGYRAEYGRVHSLVTWSRAVDQYTCELIMNKYLQWRLGKPT